MRTGAMKTVKVHLPVDETAIRALRAGTRIALSGPLVTGRDRLHKYLAEGGACPVNLRDGALYHCGPVVLRAQNRWRVLAAGPTTSLREEPYMARIIERFGVRVIIGKGGMGAATAAACRRFGCVYVQAVGGAAAVLAAAIKQVEGVHFLETFGAAEAMWALTVEGLEGMVTLDAQGNDFHERIHARSGLILRRLLRGLPVRHRTRYVS